MKELELRAVNPTLQLRSLLKHFFEIIKYQFIVYQSTEIIKYQFINLSTHRKGDL